MKRVRVKRNHDPNFEMLSDLSLSTLGLFAIVFVVYSLIFNSRNMNQEHKAAQMNETIDTLKYRNSNLIAERNAARQQKKQAEEQLNTIRRRVNQVEEQLNNARQRVEETEDKLQKALQRNQYTGYYTGEVQTRFYPQSCRRDYILIKETYNLFFVQDSNLVILTTKSSKGTINFRYYGTLSGNRFTLRNIEFTGSQGVQPCPNEYNSSVIEFYNDYLMWGDTRLNRVE